MTDPLTKDSDLPAARDSRVPATVRTEELAQISKELADANNVISNELADANVLLAKTTQASAELLAKITQESADQLRESNDISTRMMNRLTIILVAVGLIQIAVTAIAVFARSN
ncbi:MAG TPA: hypothetical protein VIK32_13475 [Candidatus Limnocylindrales bacterium]